MKHQIPDPAAGHGSPRLAAALAGGCAQLGYYMQAAQGQYALMADARPIDDWLADPSTADKLRTGCRGASEIRRFAVSELGLPDNGSYKNYADLKRPFVLWNVVATPELSLDPVKWCFPMAGCVNYRGYYSKDGGAGISRGELRQQGQDVQVGGVPAYSTLGWFNDPVLSTFINYPDAELARLVFHELAHQVVYVKDDSPVQRVLRQSRSRRSASNAGWPASATRRCAAPTANTKAASRISWTCCSSTARR